MLAQLPCLQNLTLKACPVAEQQSYQGRIISLLPQLQILDSHKVSNAAMQAKSQTQSKIAKQSSAQRSALLPPEKLPLSSRIDRTHKAHQPAMKKSTPANDKAAESTQRQQPVSSGVDEAAVIASRSVSKRKQREQLDGSGTADANADHGLSHGSSAAQEGKRAKQATSTEQAVAADRQAGLASAVAEKLGKKKPRRDMTASAGHVQSHGDSIREDRRVQHTLGMGDTNGAGPGVKTVEDHTMLAIDTAKHKASKKAKEHKGMGSASMVGKSQAQASRKAQRTSQALASGKEVGLCRSKSHQECNKQSLADWCAAENGHFMSQCKA